MQRSRGIWLIFGVILISIFLWLKNNPSPGTAEIELKKPPAAQVGQTVEVPLLVNVNLPINAAEFVFFFPKDLVTVKEIKKEGSFFELWIKDSPTFSNDDGTISIAGGLPSPGFEGKGLVATIVFTPKKSGSGQITLDDSRTRLLANDGLGTVVPNTFESIPLSIK